jgi:hypothetical protein
MAGPRTGTPAQAARGQREQLGDRLQVPAGRLGVDVAEPGRQQRQPGGERAGEAVLIQPGAVGEDEKVGRGGGWTPAGAVSLVAAQCRGAPSKSVTEPPAGARGTTP